uniref:Uncharacterized protein n=1 Tax=Oryza glaberrima TaxID=4538 RepID=I1PW02_ORYGL
MMMHCPMMKTYYAEMAHGFLLLLGSSSPLYLPPHVTAAAAAVGNCHQKDLSGIQFHQGLALRRCHALI